MHGNGLDLSTVSYREALRGVGLKGLRLAKKETGKVLDMAQQAARPSALCISLVDYLAGMFFLPAGLPRRLLGTRRDGGQLVSILLNLSWHLDCLSYLGIVPEYSRNA